MEEIRRQTFLLLLFIFLLIIFTFLYKSDFLNKFNINLGKNNCSIKVDNLCISQDMGVKANYYEASTLCSKLNMNLPTTNDAWLIWSSSENCVRNFATNSLVPINKYSFINYCTDTNKCFKYAKSTLNYCSQKPIIKFSNASQYKYGSFWIKDSNSVDFHYVLNYSSGVLKRVLNNEKSYGVRCVKYIN